MGIIPNHGKRKITIYVKPTCTTCRKVLKILRESESDFDSINYFEKPLTKKTLTELVKSLGIPPRELLRKNEAVYKELELIAITKIRKKI